MLADGVQLRPIYVAVYRLCITDDTKDSNMVGMVIGVSKFLKKV